MNNNNFTMGDGGNKSAIPEISYQYVEENNAGGGEKVRQRSNVYSDKAAEGENPINNNEKGFEDSDDE